ncbi:hypothetical protein Tco_0286519 [Tanacetum coccineum]
MPPSSSSPPRRHHPSHHRHHGYTTSGAFGRGSSQWGVCLCGLTPQEGALGFESALQPRVRLVLNIAPRVWFSPERVRLELGLQQGAAFGLIMVARLRLA